MAFLIFNGTFFLPIFVVILLAGIAAKYPHGVSIENKPIQIKSNVIKYGKTTHQIKSNWPFDGRRRRFTLPHETTIHSL